MTGQSTKVLHIICTSLLAVAFLAASIASWELLNGSTEGGANIGAGILMLFGYAVGAVGLVLGAVILIISKVARHPGRVNT